MTPSDTDAISLDELVRHAGWLRRIAGSLVHDADAAADLAQEAMIAGWRTPPRDVSDTRDVRDVRPWLATVTLNRARDWLRRESRRAGYESIAQEAATQAAQAPTPVELIGELETHRAVAEEVSALEEPFRQTLILHFYDGVSSADIGRRLGVPAGTVRWRLKEGLDRIRRRLDQRCNGDRRAWVRALVPLVPAPPPGSTRPRSLPAALAAISVLALGVALARRGCEAAPPVAGLAPAAPSLGEPVTPGGAARTVPESGRPRPGAGSTADALAACLQDLRPLREELAREEQRWIGVAQASLVFARGAPNPAAERALEPIVVSALAANAAAGLSHAIECRTWACRVVVVEPTSEFGARPESDWFQAVVEALRNPERIRGYLAHIGEPAREALTGAALGEKVLYVALKHPSGEPAGPALPLPPPPASQPACEAEMARLRQALARTRGEVIAALGPMHGFSEKSSNPALTAEVRREIDRVLDQTGDRPEYSLHCRDRVCRLLTPGADPSRVWPQLYEDAWFRTRYDDYATPQDAFYIRFAEKPREDGRRILRELVARIQRASAVGDCARRHRQTGRLNLELSLAGTPPAQRARDDGGIDLAMTGELADSALGACLRAAIEPAIAETTIPADVAGAVVEPSLAFDAQGRWRWQDSGRAND